MRTASRQITGGSFTQNKYRNTTDDSTKSGLMRRTGEGKELKELMEDRCGGEHARKPRKHKKTNIRRQK